MSNEPTKPVTPEATPSANGAADNLSREVEQLRETVKRLEAEKDEYRKSLFAVLRSQFTEKDVVIPDEQDRLTFDQFVHELEEIVNNAGGTGAAK